MIFFCLLSFASCDPGSNVLDIDYLLENTTKVELVFYNNEEPEILNLNKAEKPKFDFNKATLIETLDIAYTEDIVNELVGGDFLDWNRALNEPIGKTIILYQENGDMYVFYKQSYTDKKGSERYPRECVRFDQNGKFIEYIGDLDGGRAFYLEEIIEEYFN
jgi:hypothetical protein